MQTNIEYVNATMTSRHLQILKDDNTTYTARQIVDPKLFSDIRAGNDHAKVLIRIPSLFALQKKVLDPDAQLEEYLLPPKLPV